MQSDRIYDVIVIGGGPAGSTVAKLLAERGRSVLLVERFKMPRYKSCSGVLIQKTLDLTVKYFGEPVPDSVTCSPAENRGMIFTDDRGKEYRFEQGGLTYGAVNLTAGLLQRPPAAVQRQETALPLFRLTGLTAVYASDCGERAVNVPTGGISSTARE